ncbi:MAG: hypothetical protein K6T75_10010, partial [Acetobacteraceae bacterium]|nr:hypothetical protein [Acetobacteraceae bacterium]
VWEGAAVLVIGGKGAGKSTVLLDLVTRPGWRFLSGDKVFLETGEAGVLAHGWPDYPHLGHATVMRHPALRRAAEGLGHRVDPACRTKILLRPEVLQRALGFECVRGGVPLRWVIFPDVLGAPDTRFAPLPEPDPERVVENLEWTANNPLARWHSFLPSLPVAEALAGPVPRLVESLKACRYYRMEGPGPLPPGALEAVLK